MAPSLPHRPAAAHAPSLPSDLCLQEDVITALRNYSKGQTSKRMGQAAPPSPRPRAAGGSGASPAGASADPRLSPSGGVRKPSSPRAAGARRLLTAPPSSPSAALQLRKLAVRVAGAPKAGKPAGMSGAARESGSMPACCSACSVCCCPVPLLTRYPAQLYPGLCCPASPHPTLLCPALPGPVLSAPPFPLTGCCCPPPPPLPL